MISAEFRKKINVILKSDLRYPRDAYLFVSDVVVRAGNAKKINNEDGHLTGKQVVQSFLDYVIGEYGPLAESILRSWNLCEPVDIGNIVYNMIEVELLYANEDDSKEDFHFDLNLPAAVKKVFQSKSDYKAFIPIVV